MKGIVVCPQPRAADVGVEILESGGNDFEASSHMSREACAPAVDRKSNMPSSPVL